MTWLPPQEMQRRFDQAGRLLAAGRLPEARDQLAPVAQAAPREPAVRQLLGQILAQLGDLAGAERELAAAVAAFSPAARESAPLRMQLGVVQAHAGRAGEAEATLRAAVAADRRFPPAAGALAELLTAQGRAEEAVRVLEPLRNVPDYATATAYADALKALGRKGEAAEQHRRAVGIEPANAVAWHNLAGAEGDLQRFAAAEAATAKARGLGLDAAETWLVRARALAGLDRPDEAEGAYREVLRRRPDYVDALRELAQLIWMRTGDVERAAAPLRARPDLPAAQAELARLLQYSGDLAGADAVLASVVERPGVDARIKGVAAQMAVRIDPDRAARYAAAAVGAAPDDADMKRTLAEARLAQGDWRGALEIADALVAQSGGRDQHDLMLQTTAWRLAGDPRGAAREDYDALVRARTIDAPPGWPDLPAYLADLREGLEALHTLHTHPIGQSLRGGTQTNANLLESDHPAVRAFPQAVDGAIRAYLAALGKGDDAVRARNTGGYRFAGIWSVRLKTGGHHADHIHPQGWISSACYVAVPPVVEAGGREGWIKFGEPGAPVRPPLAPGRFEKPEPGKLVLFPSYMWHGTVPFTGEHPRLTVAFDLVPA